MNDAHCVISDEEYLPLPKQLQPTPVDRWTDFAAYAGTVGDPALQLTPDRGGRTWREPAKFPTFPETFPPSRNGAHDEPITISGRDIIPHSSTIGDPLLQLTPEKPRRPFESLPQDQNAAKCAISQARTSKEGSANSKSSSHVERNAQRRSHHRNLLGSINGPSLDRNACGGQTEQNTASKRGDGRNKKKAETVAWVEKHGDVRTIYDPGKPVQEESGVNKGTSCQQKAKSKPNKNIRRSLESRGDLEASIQSREKVELSKGSKKAGTKLKPILHKDGEVRDKARRNSKKYVTLVVDTVPGLDRPRINSTSVLAARLQELEDESFDEESVVRRNLAESEEARTTLGERAAGGANIPRNVSKYQGLISVDIPSQAVLDQAVEERLNKLKILAPEEDRPKKEPPPCPDVLDVYTPDMIVEYPNLDVSHLALPPIRLEQVPADKAFHLYRRISGWEK